MKKKLRNHCYAFSCKIHGNVIHRLKSMSNVRSILADSHISFGNNDYRAS
ncbi:hypothetical protein HanPSC8_Chr04g0169321 [Helianthus annuus]|nr:hypothetical protein HanPSC8_Chr04g0169321 [Helianthus annuus]